MQLIIMNIGLVQLHPKCWTRDYSKQLHLVIWTGLNPNPRTNPNPNPNPNLTFKSGTPDLQRYLISYRPSRASHLHLLESKISNNLQRIN